MRCRTSSCRTSTAASTTPTSSRAARRATERCVSTPAIAPRRPPLRRPSLRRARRPTRGDADDPPQLGLAAVPRARARARASGRAIGPRSREETRCSLLAARCSGGASWIHRGRIGMAAAHVTRGGGAGIRCLVAPHATTQHRSLRVVVRARTRSPRRDDHDGDGSINHDITTTLAIGSTTVRWRSTTVDPMVLRRGARDAARPDGRREPARP